MVLFTIRTISASQLRLLFRIVGGVCGRTIRSDNRQRLPECNRCREKAAARRETTILRFMAPHIRWWRVWHGRYASALKRTREGLFQSASKCARSPIQRKRENAEISFCFRYRRESWTIAPIL